MFPRVREITDAMGSRLRVSVEKRPAGALVMLELPDRLHPARICLDAYGADVLSGFIMAARLTPPGELPDECIVGAFPSRLHLRREPSMALVITQDGGDKPFPIAATFWDRLYAELSVATAHARELEKRVDALAQ